MVDKLDNEERILAWKAAWHPSFSGTAIVNKDFTFRSVNPQFCKLLGVTPADLVGNRFQDVTQPDLKKLDEKNAQMVMDGLIDFYILPKVYQFSGGREAKVVLLVTGVRNAENDFLFFVSRIMTDEEEASLPMLKELNSQQSSLKQTSTVVDFVMKYGKWMAAMGALIGGALAAFIKV